MRTRTVNFGRRSDIFYINGHSAATNPPTILTLCHMTVTCMTSQTHLLRRTVTPHGLPVYQMLFSCQAKLPGSVTQEEMRSMHAMRSWFPKECLERVYTQLASLHCYNFQHFRHRGVSFPRFFRRSSWAAEEEGPSHVCWALYWKIFTNNNRKIVRTMRTVTTVYISGSLVEHLSA